MPAAGSEVKDGNFMASILNLQRLYKACPGNRTMAINGCVISGLDPGAVPGVSTNFPPAREAFGDETGSTDV